MNTDSNLLFGVLALQADFIDAPQFVEACSAWASRKDATLGELLVKRGWLSAADRSAVERLVNRKLTKHGGDARASLAAVANEDVRQSLAAVADQDIHHSLAALKPPEVLGTVAYTPESRDRYTVTRLHAKGGIGQVWLARDHGLGREVALKDLRPETCTNPQMAARFLEEAQITGQLEHPNIVPVYELAQRPDDQRPYYTMRFVRGRTLSEAIKEYHQRRDEERSGPLELRELLSALIDVCDAVSYAHSRRVIHRDLKPQNVVLGDFGEVVLLDWGLAKLVDRPQRDEAMAPVVIERHGEVDLTMQGQVLGTPAYMAPEQAEGKVENLNARTDVYGLGAMLYEILSGHVPFPGPNTQEVLTRVRTQPPPVPHSHNPSVPRALEAICLKAMAKSQSERYASVAKLARDIRHWLGNEPVSAYPEPFSERMSRWMRRHPALTAGVVTLLLALVIGLTVGLFLLERSKQETEQERKQAEKNFNYSVSIMESSLGVLENQIADAPVAGLQPFQKKLLQQQLERYQGYPPEYQNEERIRLAIAAGHYKLGKVCQDIGTLPEALTALTKAREMYEDLPRSDRYPTTYDERIAHCHFAIGLVYLAMGRPAAAIEPLRKAIALIDGLLKPMLEADEKEVARQAAGGSGPPVSAASIHTRGWTHQETIAWCFAYLALAEHRTGKAEASRRSFERARELFNGLMHENNRTIETYPYFPNGMGFCLMQMAQCLHDQGRLSEARTQHLRAIERLREALKLQTAKPVSKNKAAVQFHNVLGLALALQAKLLMEANESAPALAALEEAIGILRPQLGDNPELVHTQARLAMALSHLGHLHLSAGRLDAAEAAFREALVVTDRLANGVKPPTTPPGSLEQAPGVVGNPEHMDGRGAAAAVQGGLGLLLLKRGQPAEALKALREAITLGELVAAHGPSHRHGLAGAQALAAGLVEDKDEQGQLTKQALATLRLAADGGYRNVEWMSRDPALESLRAHPEFQQLLAELRERAKKEGK